MSHEFPDPPRPRVSSGWLREARRLQRLVGVSQDLKRFVYVIHSLANPDRLYVEAAANVSMRIAAHNAGHSPQTAAHRPWKLVTVVQFGNEGTAQRFEKFLKSGAGRAFVKHHFV
jgi:predicted GIY-YIG superfamily endonuclease